MTGRKFDDPHVLMKMFIVLIIPTTKVGYAIGVQPRSKSPVRGAAAGRSVCETATVKTKTEIKKVTKPNQVTHPKFANVRIEEQRVVRIVETSAKTTVHLEWSDKALNAVAVVTIPAADTRTCAMIIMIPTISRPVGPQRWPIMSASVWHSGYLWWKSPRTTAVSRHHMVSFQCSSIDISSDLHVFNEVNPTIDKEPPTEPRAANAPGVLRILIAKLILTNRTVACCQLTVLNSTPLTLAWKISYDSPTSVSTTVDSSWLDVSSVSLLFWGISAWCPGGESIWEAIVRKRRVVMD
jgi:hypothetical protein